MKLYFGPAACSMSCHIALEESRLSFEPILCAWDNPACWNEVEKLNPQGAVPVLVMDNGQVMTQNIGILTYIAERAPESGLLPKPGTLERAQVYQWVSFVAADLHHAYGPLFGEGLTDTERKEAIDNVTRLLDVVEKHLQGKTFLVGNQMTIADAYLFTVYGWSKNVSVPTDRFRNLNAYTARIAERPAVQAVLKREGLTK